MPTFRFALDATLDAANETDVHGQVGRHFQALSAGAKPESPFAKGAKITVVEVKTKKPKAGA